MQPQFELLSESSFLRRHVVTPPFTTLGIPISPNLLVPCADVSQPACVRGQLESAQFFPRKLSEQLLVPPPDVVYL